MHEEARWIARDFSQTIQPRAIMDYYLHSLPWSRRPMRCRFFFFFFLGSRTDLDLRRTARIVLTRSCDPQPPMIPKWGKIASMFDYLCPTPFTVSPSCASAISAVLSDCEFSLRGFVIPAVETQRLEMPNNVLMLNCKGNVLKLFYMLDAIIL